MNLQTFLRKIAKMNKTLSSSISSIQLFGVGLLFAFLIPSSGLASSNLQDYLTAFKDKRADVRKSAIERLLDCLAEDKECLEGGGPDAFKQLVTAVIDLLADSDPKVREAAILYLKQSTDVRVLKPIARLLRDENDAVRATAAEAFNFMKVDGAVVRELERLLMDKNKRVRMGAASSLGLNGTQKSLGLLRGVLARETDSEARDVYAEIIKELQSRPNMRGEK